MEEIQLKKEEVINFSEMMSATIFWSRESVCLIVLFVVDLSGWMESSLGKSSIHQCGFTCVISTTDW